MMDNQSIIQTIIRFNISTPTKHNKTNNLHKVSVYFWSQSVFLVLKHWYSNWHTYNIWTKVCGRSAISLMKSESSLYMKVFTFTFSGHIPPDDQNILIGSWCKQWSVEALHQEQQLFFLMPLRVVCGVRYLIVWRTLPVLTLLLQSVPRNYVCRLIFI